MADILCSHGFNAIMVMAMMLVITATLMWATSKSEA